MKKKSEPSIDIDDILGRYILIQRLSLLEMIILILAVFTLSIFIPFEIDIISLIGLEQSLFVMLSAVLFVFNESIIGFKTISKVTSTLSRLQEKVVKDKVLTVIGLDDSSFYEEFTGKLKKRIDEFFFDTRDFKSRSYSLYIIFALLGFLALSLILIKSDTRFIQWLLSYPIMPKSLLLTIKMCSIDLFVKLQFISILIWIISAVQAEKQKKDLIDYLDGGTIVDKVEKYIHDKKTINVQLSLRNS